MAFHKYHLPSNAPLSLWELLQKIRRNEQGKLKELSALRAQDVMDFQSASGPANIPLTVPLLHLHVSVFVIVKESFNKCYRYAIRFDECMVTEVFPRCRMQRRTLRIRSVNWRWTNRSWSGRR